MTRGATVKQTEASILRNCTVLRESAAIQRVERVSDENAPIIIIGAI